MMLFSHCLGRQITVRSCNSIPTLSHVNKIIQNCVANIHLGMVKRLTSPSNCENTNQTPLYIDYSPELSVIDEHCSGSDVIICQNFVNENEEQNLLLEIESAIKRLRYQSDHWDDAIHGYRETEKANWNPSNAVIIERIKKFAFPPGSPTMKLVHVLDLQEDGFIKPHIDSVRFCGNTVAGLSLMTDSVMRFVSASNKSLKIDIFLARRSLYIMRNAMRYDFTHEILHNKESFFNGEQVHKSRRMSVICRNEPPPSNL
ncbi:unnamed protein product [Bemisia tabaci]|uniref:Alpha-ketoglutarate-dependent dioxygenase AlkB-like domain-containing protein n=1 Tax=Bemisia tabaci TaxID=7038 RepID=A0A9P0A2R9_BEMTA|nr:unnamed protein product [Bemisia tabaci]